MFTLFRDPTNTVISAYYHFNQLKKMKLLDFCYQATDMQIKFLLGYDINSSHKVTVDDFNKVKDLIKNGKLVVGIQRTKSMNAIYNLLELPLDKVDNYVLNKKIDVNYKARDIDKGLRQHIKKINVYDNLLYDYILNS